MRHLIKIFAIVLLFSVAGCSQKQSATKKKKPNVVFILADDLGYGDVSCYGHSKFQTPHIDKLATEGMMFTNNYAGSTVCAPSRSALMTGLHTGHTPIRGNVGVKPEGQYPMPDTLLTIPKLFKEAGYVTGAFGKWGLGYPGSTGDPEHQGFDEFFGYNCQTLAHNYYPYYLRHNNEKVELKENEDTLRGIYSADLINQKAMEFIRENKDTSFFIFIPSALPHAELVAPERQMEKFRGKYLPEATYTGVDSGPRFRKGPYGSQKEAHAAFAGMVDLLDSQVGSILSLLNELNLEDNTIVIFTSDNGPHVEGGADPDYFDSNGPLKGYKRDLYEGGIRVPLIIRWPGKVTVGSTSGHVSAFWDWLPTFAELLKSNDNIQTDGISILPTILSNGDQKKHDFLYWEFYENSGRVAVLKDNWKLVKYHTATDSPEVMLFNLSDDIGEEHNVADQHPDIVRELDSLANISHLPQDPAFEVKMEKVRE